MNTTDEFMAFYRQCKAVLPPRAAERTFAYIAEWQEVLDGVTNGQISAQELGVEHFCEFMRVDRRTVYRRNADFRRAFPKCATPAQLLTEMRAAA